MDIYQIIVTATGLAAIVLVLWYFFGASKAVSATADDSGVQTTRINVKGGYEPSTIVAHAGQPIRIEFYRDETSSCSDQVVFPALGITRDLPAFKTTIVEFTPETPGEFKFSCGMNMLHGRLIVTRNENTP